MPANSFFNNFGKAPFTVNALRCRSRTFSQKQLWFLLALVK